MRRIFKYLLIHTILIVFGLNKVHAQQDIQFSQFYATSLYQSPAFAGGAHLDRAIIHERLQWMAIDGKFHTSLASFDTYFPEYKSGFGGYFLRDIQGDRNIRSLQVALQYAYELHLNDTWAVRLGLQSEFVQRSLNYSVLTFPSQYTGDSDNPFSANTGDITSKFYADFGTGALFYTDAMWFGATVHHLNTPNQSFVGGDVPLQTKYSFTGGYQIRFKNDKDLLFRDHPTSYFIMPTFHYKSQGKFDQLDIGAYVIYDHLLTGLWYRGIPIKKFDGIQNNESFVVMFGWELKQVFDIRYSHDFVVSTLSQPTARTGGSHEINVALLLHQAFKKKSSQRLKRLPCPDHHIHY